MHTRILKSVYNAIFDYHLNCANTVLGQNNFFLIGYSYYRRKSSELIVLNVEILSFKPSFL